MNEIKKIFEFTFPDLSKLSKEEYKKWLKKKESKIDECKNLNELKEMLEKPIN